MNGERQKNRQQPTLWEDGKGEARTYSGQGTEPPTAKRSPESPAEPEQLMEVVTERENMKMALEKVVRNEGSPGVDGMTVKELAQHLATNWDRIKEQLLSGTYKPSPVRRVEIPKPGGGKRPLGIPTVTDRLIQQALLQVLNPIFEPTFSESSYGFRPRRSAHQAVARAQGYIEEGYTWVVDIDLEKFFDRVNHDMLMARVARKVKDKRALKLLRAFLKAGVMEGGLVSPTTEGTPQGGPISPLLSNILLDDLDKELERRGHRFVRYADDCNIYVASERAGQRVMDGITRFVEKKLKLRVNREKSAVDRPRKRNLLSFSFTGGANPKRRIAPKAKERMKTEVRRITRRSRGVSTERVVEELNRYLRGWRAYFGFCETPSVFRELDAWIRRRLRMFIWTQWKTRRNRIGELMRLGVDRREAFYLVLGCRGPWRCSMTRTLHKALPNAYFTSLGLFSLYGRV